VTSRSILVLCIAFAAPQLAAHGDLHKRIAMLTKKIRTSPKSAELYAARGELHRLHKDWATARRDYATARSLRPELRGLDFRRGRMELQASRPAIAIRYLSAELRRGPHVLARIFRARSLVKLGRWEAALVDYDAAVQAKTRASVDHYLERARLQIRMGHRSNRVVAGIDQAIERHGPLVSLQVFALDLEVAARDWAAALSRVDRTLPRLPLKSPWLLRRGRILRSMRKPAAARKAFESGIRELHALRRRNAIQQTLLTELKRSLTELAAER
jgi:tetratricopeptide (TPR) repeat protein